MVGCLFFNYVFVVSSQVAVTSTPFSVSSVKFEHVIAGWVIPMLT